MTVQANITPLMKQYLEIKNKNPGSLLFFRMGDFYELFFDDAYLASEILNITLTKRGKLNGTDIPMCGVPHHASERYIETLIKKGLHIAICEQIETPEEAKKRSYKAIVKREVIRTITPGTIIEENLLENDSSNFLLAINEIREDFSVAWTDISTGRLFVSSTSKVEIESIIERIKPREILVSNNYAEQRIKDLKKKNYKVTVLSVSSFNTNNSEDKLMRYYGVKSIKSFGVFSYSMIGALGAILDYLSITQSGNNLQLMKPILEKKSSILEIDQHTRKNLEINLSLMGEKKGSLVSVLDKTITSFGSRLLESRVNAPLAERKPIIERLSVTNYFFSNPQKTESLRVFLNGCPDFERAFSRLNFYKNNINDFLIIKKGIIVASKVRDQFIRDGKEHYPRKLKEIIETIYDFDDILILIKKILSEKPLEIGSKISHINFEYDPDLDNLRNMLNENEIFIKKLEEELILITNISSLKIKQNNVLGYFLEVTSKNAELIFEKEFDKDFIHRQTTANTVRFTTNKLISFENKINSSTSKIDEIESRIYRKLKEELLNLRSEIRSAALALGELDFFSSLGMKAGEENWVKPKIYLDKMLEICEGRHPVVEKNVKEKNDISFIPNDCNLNFKNTLINLITGPNMAGKSTFLRQNALIIIMAQLGSFVPATEAKIGIVDRVFSRIGASDDLSQGHSTFMVEMLETATILNQATENSFVILDEIGRGTSTFDGLSIAWATLEHLHNKNNCRTLFATHYHELTVLEKELPFLTNMTVKIKEHDGELIFLHKVIDGFSNQSFGIKVAKLAGIPEIVIDRAFHILASLEKNSTWKDEHKKAVMQDKLKINKKEKSKSEIEDLIKSLNIDEISPKESLHLLYKIQQELKT